MIKNIYVKGKCLFYLCLITSQLFKAQTGAALDFDPAAGGDNVVLPQAMYTNSLQGGNKITIEAWANPTSTVGFGCIIGNHLAPNIHLRFLLRRDDNTWAFWTGDGITSGGWTSATSTNFTLNTWQHVAGVYDGTVMTIYVNGVLSGSASASYSFGPNTNSIVIGTAGPESFSGQIDEIRVWNTARTQCQINTFMNCEIPNDALGLIANYHFNQGIATSNNATVTTLNDATSNAFNGTLNSFSLSGSSSNWVVPGGVVSNFTTAASSSISVTANSSFSICNGVASTFTAGGAATYSWVPAAGLSATTGSNVIVTPTITTNYSVVGTATNGCTNTQSLTVTVLPNPNVSVSNMTICNGGVATLTAIGANTYTWNTGSNASSITISPTVSTTYTVTGTNTITGCTNTRTVSLVVASLPTVTAVSISTAICNGITTTLTAGGANTYTWTSGPATSQYTVNLPGTYTVTGTNTVTGCTNTRTVTIIANPSPTITAVASSTAICVGATATLTAAGGNTYTWTSGPATSQYTVNTTGTYTVTGTNTVTGCINTQTVSLLVNSLPTVTAVSTSTAICVGATATLTAGGANTYTWTSGPTASQYTVNTTGTYTVTGTNTVTGCTNTRTVSLLANPLPTVTAVSSNSAICNGITTTLTAGGANTYTWTSGPTTSQYTVNLPGTYTVTGTNTLTGCTNTRTVTIIANPSPTITAVASSTAICAGATATLTAGGGNTYTWTSGSATSQYTVNTTGTYTVTGTNTVTGCINTQTVSLLVNPLPTVTAVASSTAICAGATATLTAGGANTHTWTSGPTTSQYTVNTTGTYTVTGTNTVTGCINTQTVSLLVNPLPTITAAASSTAICSGGIATLTAGGGNTYTWTSGPVSSNYVVNTTGTYSVTGADVNGCVYTNTVGLLVNPIPIVTAVTSSPYICSGFTATLTAGGASSYTWLPGGGTGNPLIVNLSTSTTYTIIGSTLGCEDTTTALVTIKSLPTPTIEGNMTLCEHQNLNLIASGGIAYEWKTNQGISIFSQSMSVSQVSLSTGGIYNLTVTAANGCSSATTIPIIVLANPLPIVSNTSVCIGSSAILNASGGISYQWSGPNAYSSNASNAFIPSANSVFPEEYRVIVTGANSCTSMATASVFTIPVPTASAFVTSKPCINTIVTLQGFGGDSYQWQGPNSFFASGQNTTFNATSLNYSGIYTLTVVNNSGCSSKTFTSITINDIPKMELISNVRNGCVPFCEKFKFKNTSTSEITNINWQVTNNYVSPLTDGFITCINKAGVYSVTGSFTNALDCFNTITFSIQVYPKPFANFDYLPKNPIAGFDEVVFTDQSESNPILAWSWSFINNSGYNTNTQNVRFLFENEGTYPVALIVKNTWGCSDTIVKNIQVNPNFNIFVPNTFSPNQDDNNEIFQPKGTGIVKYNLSVYDRWGEKLFETDDFATGWDGNFRGQICKSDLYIWKIALSGKDSKVKELVGHVSLYR